MSTKDKKVPGGDKLPKNWKVFHSKKHNNSAFYYNTVTHKKQWAHPLTGEKSINHEAAKPTSNKSKNTTGDRNGTKCPKDIKKQQGMTRQTNVPPDIKQQGMTRQTNVPPDIKQQGMTRQTNVPPDIKQQRMTLQTNVPPDINSEPVEPTKPACIKPKGALPCENKKLNGRFRTLPPIIKHRTLGNCNEESISDCSERITAWLVDTSQINFTEHPVPGTHVADKKPKSIMTNAKQDSSIKSGSSGKTGGVKKVVSIFEKVKSNTDSNTEKKVHNILDELLPKHALHNAHKTRYAPYKPSGVTSESKTRSRKSGPSLEEKTSIPQTTKRKKSDSAVQPIGQTNTAKPKFPHETVFQIKKKQGPLLTAKANANQAHQPSVSAGFDFANIPAEVKLTGNKGEDSNIKDNKLNNDSLLREDTLPMDEEVGVSVVPSLPDSEVADMEIDNAEQYEKQIVQKLQQIRDNLVVDPSNVSQEECSSVNISTNGYEGSLYIILDTNVLLSHLKFVVELKDFPIQGVGRPILVIPWVVIQELDSLKDSKWRTHQTRSSTDSHEVEERVDMLARVAIKFLNGCFQMSDPRVRGQTIDEAAAHIENLKEESNDDRILQCCLLFQERAQNGNCVLFSNDRNLCNKALVNGIKAFSHQKLIPGLRDLFECGVIVKQAYFKEYKTQIGIQEKLASRREKADEILCELQIILREGLSYIIETEMKEAYDDLWPEIVHIKPPWTLDDVLLLLEKHWIAVFGHVLKRNHKTYIAEMRKKFDDRKGSPSSLVFSSEVLQLSLKLFQSFAAHSNYNDAIPKCLAAVNVLVEKCQQFEAKGLTELAQNANVQQKCLENTNVETAEEQDGILNGNSVSAHSEVMNTFNLIWTAVTQFSTQIFTALGYPNSFPNELQTQDLPRASKEEAIQFLGVLCPRLINLVGSIQNVLRDPWVKASQNNNLFLQLHQAITVFLKEVMSRDNNANAEKLFSFCQDASTRTSLVQGLSQLGRASAMLQHCASCVAQPSGI